MTLFADPTSTQHDQQDLGLVPLDEANEQEEITEVYDFHKSANNEEKKKRHSAIVREASSSRISLDSPVSVSWDGPNDPNNPQNFSSVRKWVITIVCCFLTVNATFASAAPSLTSGRLQEHFGNSEEVSDLVTSLFLMGYVLGPIIWGPGSEFLGRKNILLFALFCYDILFIGQALAKNIGTVVVLRFFSGAFAVGPLIICGGIFADIWDARGRGYAVALFGGCVFVGPSLGPLVGGFVADSRLGWEWIYWIMMMFGGLVTGLTLIGLPETYGPVLLTYKAQRLRKQDPIKNANVYSDHEKQDKSLKGTLERTLYRPWKIMANEPILILVTIYMALIYGLLYALFESFPLVFVEKRNLSLSDQGLIFIGIGIGSVITMFLCLYYAYRFNKLIPTWRGFPPAEERLYPAMIGALLLVLSSLWFGWTGNDPSIPWYVPGLATVFIGLGITSIFMSFLTYIVDTYLLLSASALASNTVIRSLSGAVFPLFTTQMYDNLGIGWASTLVALLSLLLAPMPFLFYKYGARIRSKSKYAPCLDLKIAKQIKEEEEAERQAMELTIRAAAQAEAGNAQIVDGVLPELGHQLANTLSEVNEALKNQAVLSKELIDAVHQLNGMLSPLR